MNESQPAAGIPRLSKRVEEIEICLKGDMEKPGRLSQMDDHEKRLTAIECTMGMAVKGVWTLVAIGFVGVVSFVWNMVIG